MNKTNDSNVNLRQKKNLLNRKYIKKLIESNENIKQVNSKSNNAEEKKLIKEKKVAIHDLVNYKREILLSKLKIEDKKTHMKDLERYVDDQERQITMKVKAMNSNTNAIRKNFHDLKKEVESSKKELSGLELLNKEKSQKLTEVENEIYQKEMESRKTEEEANMYLFYKGFIKEIYDHSSKKFDEKEFRKKIEDLLIKQNMTFDIGSNKFFYITEGNKLASTATQKDKSVQDFIDEFIKLLDNIEDDNFDLIYQLQNQEINYYDLERKILKPAEDNKNKLNELNKTYGQLHNKEKELREKLKQKMLKENEILNELKVEPSKKGNKKDMANQNGENFLDINKIRKKLFDIMQQNGIPFKKNQSTIEMLKSLEIQFEKYYFDATLIYKNFPDYYQKRLRELTTISKKDNTKPMVSYVRKRISKSEASVAKRLNEIQKTKNQRRAMKKYILKREEIVASKETFDQEQYEYERYFT